MIWLNRLMRIMIQFGERLQRNFVALLFTRTFAFFTEIILRTNVIRNARESAISKHTCFSSLTLQELNVAGLRMIGQTHVLFVENRIILAFCLNTCISNGFVSSYVSILGVWSVSTLISDVQEDKGSAGSSNRESYAQNDKPSKNICLFADRQRASLVICDSLDSNCKEHCYSPALDREMRIKELKRKREKLLADVGQSRAAASQTNL